MWKKGMFKCYKKRESVPVTFLLPREKNHRSAFPQKESFPDATHTWKKPRWNTNQVTLSWYYSIFPQEGCTKTNSDTCGLFLLCKVKSQQQPQADKINLKRKLWCNFLCWYFVVNFKKRFHPLPFMIPETKSVPESKTYFSDLGCPTNKLNLI